MEKFLKLCFVILGLIVTIGNSTTIKPTSRGIDPGVVHRTE